MLNFIKKLFKKEKSIYNCNYNKFCIGDKVKIHYIGIAYHGKIGKVYNSDWRSPQIQMDDSKEIITVSTEFLEKVD